MNNSPSRLGTNVFLGHNEPALRQAIASRPGDIQAYADLASLLFRLERTDEAMALLEGTIANYPHEIWPLSLKAAALTAEHRADEALRAHAAVLGRARHATVPWMNYGYALKTVGRTAEAVTAYRKAIALDTANGAAWWGLANLRTVQLGIEDVALMERALQRGGGHPLQYVQLHFALGKGLADLGRYERSFRHYEEANRLRGELAPYDAEAMHDFVRSAEASFTSDFFAQHGGYGHDAANIIFIVGMPRSGSTLVEQILASHPMIEGGGELFELQEIAEDIRLNGAERASMAEAISELKADELHMIGARYLASVRRHRRTDRSFFTDKMPANWQLTPLIHLILPNAKIVDVRRDPVACCFSAFTTYFNRHTRFPTKLTDLARYYNDYIRMTAHMDSALPGRIHRVRYERLVEDFEAETSRLLDHLGLPFDPACRLFNENPRAVHTPSAQQVRRPINRDGLDHWRNYERWLGPLQAAT